MELIKLGFTHSSFPFKVSIGWNIYSFCVDCRDVNIVKLGSCSSMLKSLNSSLKVSIQKQGAKSMISLTLLNPLDFSRLLEEAIVRAKSAFFMTIVRSLNSFWNLGKAIKSKRNLYYLKCITLLDAWSRTFNAFEEVNSLKALKSFFNPFMPSMY